MGGGGRKGKGKMGVGGRGVGVECGMLGMKGKEPRGKDELNRWLDRIGYGLRSAALINSSEMR